MASRHRVASIIIASALLITAVQSGLIPSQRLSIVDWDNYDMREHNGPGTYAFGYDIEDPATNNVQFRHEERHPNGTVTGSYGYVEPDGNVRIVHYVADEKGYRVTEENNGLKLSMLRPLSPFASPQHQNYRAQEIHDQRTRPFDQFYNNHNANNRENWYFQHNLINNGLPVNDNYDDLYYGGDRYLSNNVQFPDFRGDGYEVYEEPRRYYYYQ